MKNNKIRLSICSTILAITVFIQFSSCKKCMTCNSTIKSTGAAYESYPESCGKKGTLDAQELNYRANLPDSISITCSRD